MVLAKIDSTQQNGKGNTMNINPEVAPKFTPLADPFYTTLHTLLQPHMLPCSSIKGTKLNAQKEVEVTLSVAHLNSLSEDLQEFPRREVQIRFFNLTKEGKKEYPDELPRSCSVTMQNEIQDAMGDRPVNITSHLMSYPEMRTHIVRIQWVADDRKFALGIYLVKRVNTEELMRIVKNGSFLKRSYSETEETIKKKLSGGDDEDVTMNSLKISLLCPLSKTRMKIAARPRYCTHLQCFDLQTFFQMNEVRPKWRCCVCNDVALYRDIVIEEYFTTLLTKFDESVTDVELLKDGSYRGIRDNNDESVKESPVRAAAPSASSTSASVPPVQQKELDDVITLSDDEEEREPTNTLNSSSSSIVQNSTFLSNSFTSPRRLRYPYTGKRADSTDSMASPRPPRRRPSGQKRADSTDSMASPSPPPCPSGRKRADLITISEDESPVNSASSSTFSSSLSRSSPPITHPRRKFTPSFKMKVSGRYIPPPSPSVSSSPSTSTVSRASSVSSACRQWGAKPIRTPIKVPVKASSKAPVKASAKVPVKASAKVPVKASAKVPVKAPVKKMPQAEPDVITLSDDEDERMVLRRSKRLRSVSTSRDSMEPMTAKRKSAKK